MTKLLIALITVAPLYLYAQLTDWSLVAGGSGDDRVRAVMPVSGGGFLAAGHTGSFGTGGDGWVIRTDADGETLWTRTYGGDGHDAFFGACAADGGYLLAGYTTTGTGGGLHAWFVRISAVGDTLWTARHHDYDVTAVNAVVPVPGGFVAAGSGARGSGFGDEGWLIRLNGDGTRAWTRTYGGAENDKLTAIAATGTGFIAAGITGSYGHGGTDAWLLRLDADGDTVWTRTFGGSEYDGANAVLTDGSGFVFGGYREMPGAYDINGWLYRVDAAGDSVWAHAYGGSRTERVYGIIPATGGYALCGETDSRGAGLYDAWLVRTGPDGLMFRDETFGGNANDRAYAVCPAPGGGYVVCGETRSSDNGGDDAYLVGVDAAVNPVTDRIAGRLNGAAVLPGLMRLQGRNIRGMRLRCIDGTALPSNAAPGCYLVVPEAPGGIPTAVIAR